MTAADFRVPEYDAEPPDLGVLDALGEDFADLKRVLATLSENVPMALDVDDTTETVVGLLADLRAQYRELGTLVAYVEAAAAKRLHYGKQTVAGYLAEVKGGDFARAHWNHPSLIRAVCGDVIYDQETGAPVEESAHIVGLVIDRVLKAAAISYWRTTVLREQGVDPDAYCDRVQGRKTVKLTPVVDEAAAE